MTTTATTQTFGIDPSHSSAEFVVRHLMIAKVRGRFTAVGGTITLPAGGELPTAVEATLEVASVSTGDAQRDGHLQSADFFDAATFPKITFASTSITSSDDGFDLAGDLTIRDQTHPVVLKSTYEGTLVDPYGKHRVGFEAHGKINRKDFGLVFNIPLDAGGVAIGDEVKIELSIEAVAQ